MSMSSTIITQQGKNKNHNADTPRRKGSALLSNCSSNNNNNSSNSPSLTRRLSLFQVSSHFNNNNNNSSLPPPPLLGLEQKKNSSSFLQFYFTGSNQLRRHQELSSTATTTLIETHLADLLLIAQLLQLYPFEEREEEEQQTHSSFQFCTFSSLIFESPDWEIEQQYTATYIMSNHQIDYSHAVVKSFLDNLNNVLQSSATSGADAKTYDTIWLQLGNKDLATVYITVLLGKLLLTEQKALSNRQSEPNITDSADPLNATNVGESDLVDEDISIHEVVETLALGTHKYDPQHPLLVKRKESIKRRRAKSIILQTDEILSKEDVDRPLAANDEAGDEFDMSDSRDEELFERQFSSTTGLQNDRGVFSDRQFRERAAIMNSLLYVSLFYRFDHQNPSLLDVLEKWRTVRAKQVQSGNTDADFIPEELKDTLCPPIEALYKYMQLCADYDIVRDVDIALRPTLSTSDPLTIVANYAYARIQTVCRIPRYTENVLGDLIILLRSTSTNQSNLTDSYNATSLKNSLNLVKLILPQLYIERDSAKLVELSNVLKQFFLEPLPIGGMIHEVLRMCQQLQKDPGCLMRDRFERAIRKCKDPNNGMDKIDRQRKVHVFYNPLSKKAHHLLDRFAIHPENVSDIEIITAKANLVLNVFAQSGNKDLITASHELYKRVTPEVLAQYYYKVSQNSTNHSELKNLKDELLKLPSVTSPPTYKRLESPKMPEVEFEFIALPEEKNLAECEREGKVFPRCGFYDKLIDVIEKARSESGLSSDSDEVLYVDIAVAGGSGTLQYFVHSLFLANKLKLLTDRKPHVDFRVYLLPLGENNYLSNWLEKHDGWFSRHIHHLLVSNLPLLPHLRTANANRANIARNNLRLMREANSRRSNTIISPSGRRYMPLDPAVVAQYKPPKKFLTPHRYMQTLLSDYVIDGHVSYPVHIYNAQFLCNEVVTISDPSGGNKTSQQKSRKVKEYISLSFCQRIDIGIVADAYQFAKDERIEGTPLDELLSHRNFRYQAPPLAVSYVPMDPTGETNRSSEINEQPKTYQNIFIRSCSSFGDRGALVSPSQPWLEVFAENITKKKSKLKDCDIGTNYHVGSISIESTTHQQFSVLLDGELYGPFHKMIINASTQTFNLQTFNNVDIY